MQNTLSTLDLDPHQINPRHLVGLQELEEIVDEHINSRRPDERILGEVAGVVASMPKQDKFIVLVERQILIFLGHEGKKCLVRPCEVLRLIRGYLKGVAAEAQKTSTQLGWISDDDDTWSEFCDTFFEVADPAFDLDDHAVDPDDDIETASELLLQESWLRSIEAERMTSVDHLFSVTDDPSLRGHQRTQAPPDYLIRGLDYNPEDFGSTQL